MPLPPPPNHTLQVDHFGTTSGYPWHIIQHARWSGAGLPDAHEADDVAEAFRGFMTTVLTAYATDALVFEGTNVRFWGLAGAFFDGVAANPVLGTVSGDPYALSSAIVVSWRVRSAWRGGRPRSYFPGIPESAVADGRDLDDDVFDAMQSNVDGYLTSVTGLTSGGITVESLAVLRRYTTGGIPPHPHFPLDPPQLIDIHAAIVRRTIGSQRRRLHR